MTKHIKLIIIALALVGAVAGGFYFLGGGTDQEPAQKESAAERRAEVRRQRVAARKQARAKRLRKNADNQTSAKGKLVKNGTKVRPSIVLEDDEMAALSTEQRALVESIQKALDDDNRAQVLKIVQNLQKSKDWPTNIPLAIRREALEAATWFGIDALPEIAGFLADANEEIRTEAIDACDSTLLDANGDREKSMIVTSVATVITDTDAMDSLLMSLNEMRPSVAVETIKTIWATGTEAAKTSLKEAVEFLTGEDNIDTPEKLDAWYNDPSGDNMDDEDAEETYGPSAD